MKNRRIFVYSEDTPVDRNVVAHGLHRAAPPVIRSILDHIDGIALYPVGRRFKNGDFDQSLLPLCTSLPVLPTILCKILRRYAVIDMGISDTMPARLLSPTLLNSKADTILAFIGADIGTLTRSAKLAALAGKSYALYIVDDFLTPLRLAGMKQAAINKAKDRAGAVLRGASHIFTITNGLGELLRETYGVSSTSLPLAFELEPKPILSPKNQIIFVGSINFLYTSGLQDLFKAVEHARSSSGVNLTVRLTVPVSVAEDGLGKLPPFVTAAPVESSKGLATEIASSLFSFLPYSFDERHRAMVSTSFPSKSMEYLAYARSILVYGPDYGVATQYFRDAGLPSVASSLRELEQATSTHLAAQPDYSTTYREYLLGRHSLAAARKTLCADLALD